MMHMITSRSTTPTGSTTTRGKIPETLHLLELKKALGGEVKLLFSSSYHHNEYRSFCCNDNYETANFFLVRLQDITEVFYFPVDFTASRH